MGLVMRKPTFCTCEIKAQISFAVLNSDADQRLFFATQIAHFLYFLARFCNCTARFVSDLFGNTCNRTQIRCASLGSWFSDLVLLCLFFSNRSLKDVSEIYTYMMFKVGEKAWLSSQRRAHMKIIDMYHSALLSEDQQRITLEFTKENSNIRCVIATIAFGLGVDVRDIKYIFHWGPSKSPLQYWQEVGRCSRNGERGECYMYITPRSLDPRRCDDAMVKVIRSDQCLRVAVLEHLVVPGMDVSRLEALRKRKSCTAGCFKCICPLCVCCSRCSASCGCNSPN